LSLTNKFMNENDIDNSLWNTLLKRLSEQFGTVTDMFGVLYLIGVQELGQGFKNFTRGEKSDLINLATCTLLGKDGYCTLQGYDSDKWPLWKATDKLRTINEKEKETMLKKLIIKYFQEIEII